MSIKIMGRKILLREIIAEEKEETTKAGIIIPNSVKPPRSILKGEVVSFGLDCHLVKEGSIIYFDINSAAQIDFEGEPYVVIDESTIFAVED